MSDEYKPRKFDLKKGGIFASNPPKEYGLAWCKGCDQAFETKDWEDPKVKCEDCKKKEKELPIAKIIRKILYLHLWNTYREFCPDHSPQDINKLVAKDYQLLMSNIKEAEQE